jgi:NAD(P)-dependent dehydrogenase (short-subunit alcohol dehydrogenase family)
MRLKNVNALITGGTSGIGLGIAERFKKEGAKGIIIGRDRTQLEKSIVQLDDHFVGISADVTDINWLNNAFSENNIEYKSINVLVLCAGGAIAKNTIQDISFVDTESFDQHINLNFRSVFFTLQAALPYLSHNSSIIVITSSALHKGIKGMSVYAACKAAVRSLVRSFANEYSALGIRVNAISPGPIETPVFEKFGLPDEIVFEMKKNLLTQIPLNRFGLPADIGGLAAMLASDDGAFITGTEIIVDGGLTQI